MKGGVMNPDACPLPGKADETEEAIIKRLLEARRIAVVGLSDDPNKPSHGVARYLREHGKEIIPINPGHSQIMGLKSYGSLEEVPGTIDLVDVFRRAEYCAEVVRSAIKVGAKGVWLQSGIVNEEAKRLAKEAGIDFIQNRCLMVEHRRRGK
jgi:uncharacterized protein